MASTLSSPTDLAPPGPAADAVEAGARRESSGGLYGDNVGAQWGADDDLDVNGSAGAPDASHDGEEEGGEGEGVEGAKTDSNGDSRGGGRSGGKQVDVALNGTTGSHKPRAEPRASLQTHDGNASGLAPRASLPQIQTVTITAEDVASALVSVVDPWVPRLRNNDEYLRRGLDFSHIRARKEALSGEKEEEAEGDEKKSEREDGEEDEGKGEGGNQRQTQCAPLVGDVGAARLAEALLPNTRLASLNLSRNDIGPEGGIALAKCLYALNPDPEIGFESKTALRVLNLAHNRIGDGGACAFALALRHNASLQELRLSDNGINVEGIIQLVGGLEHNAKVKRLGLGDNVRRMPQVWHGERGRLVECIEKACEGGQVNRGRGGSALEVLEMHCRDDAKPRWESDHFDGLTKDELSALQLAMWRNARLRTLTLASASENEEVDKEQKQLVHSLRRIFGFNSFYRPILQLHDIQRSPLAVAESSLGLPVKLPGHLKRDERSGALIGLLPSASKAKSARASSSTGLEYKLLPRALGFACSECSLDVAWNVVRYRPDMFCCVGEGTVVECAPCGFLGGEGCCVS